MGVPAGTKFIGISASVDTVEKKSAQANSPSDVYTIEDIKDGSVPDSRTITINGNTQDLSANRTWNISTGITVGTTAVTSGTDGRVFFQEGGVVQQDANFTYDNTLKRLGLKAAGTAATDIPFQIQNSAGTANLVRFNGDGTHFFYNSTGATNINFYQYGHGIWANGASNFRIKNLNGSTSIEGTTSTRFITDVTNKSITFDGKQLHIGGQALPTINGDSAIVIESGTAPTTSISDRFYLYSADRGGVAGKAAAHFRAEDGTINVLGDLSGIGTTSPGARLDVKAQGALSTDIAFRVRNSADTANLASINGVGDIALGEGATGVNVTNYPFVAIGKNAKASQYGITIGSESGKNQDNGDRRNVYIGIGVAQLGTNSTATYNVGIGNNALRNISSGNNNTAIGGIETGQNLTTGSDNVLIGKSAGLELTQGNANTFIGVRTGSRVATGNANTNIGIYNGFATGITTKSYNTKLGVRLTSSHDGVIMIGTSGDYTSTVVNSITDDAAQFHFRSANQSFFFNKNTNVVLKSNSSLTSGTDFEAAATNTFTIHNGTAPVANIADATAFYSADITAGNAAPHFRTENGSIVKLYQETAGVAAATLVGGGGTTITDTDTFGGYTLQQIAQALKNLGILA